MDFERAGLSRYGFVQVVKGQRRSKGRDLFRRVKELALNARQHAEFSRVGLQRSDYFAEHGHPIRAKIEVDGALADHRRAAQYLLDLADTCRALMQWSAFDWLPCSNVEGSGLTPVELQTVSEMIGGDFDAIRNV